MSNIEEKWEEEIGVDGVTHTFKNFLNCYDAWRKQNSLSSSIENKYEITTSLADKVGRICRQVKHFERNDPKPDWPDGMTEDISGVLVYLIILMKSYDIDLSTGLTNELAKSIEQHSK